MDIDRARIKQEVDDDIDMDFDGVKIIKEATNMITVIANDHKSEDERKFIESLASINPDQLFTESSRNYLCKFCQASFRIRLEYDAHMVNHKMNRHFCRFGCSFWCDSLEQILEHEYKNHSQGLKKFCCRVCDSILPSANDLTKHMLIHVYGQRYVCALCRRHFESHQGLQLHRKHSKEICGQIESINGVSHRIELVATAEKCQLPAELLCDVQIKEEPKDYVDDDSEHEIRIKEEPMDEEEESPKLTASIKPNLGLDWRSKLRLPALKPKPELMTSAPTQSNLKIVNWNNQSATNTAILKRPNILKTNSNSNSIYNNNKKPLIAENILQMLPSNFMVIKLPPNTKILKLPREVNKTTLKHSSITTPGSVQITQVVKQDIQNINSSTVDSNSVKVVSSPPRNNNRLGTFHQEAFYDLESRPESRKMIEEIQNQIRSIERTLPIPGSVLQTKTKRSFFVHSKNLSTDDKKDEPTKLELLLNPACSNVWQTLFEKYPNYCFFWACPMCPTSCEQAQDLRRHLSRMHSMSDDKLNTLKVTLLPKKVLDGEEQLKPSIQSGKISVAPQLTANASPVNENLQVSSPEPPISKSSSVPKPKATASQQQHECNECSKTYTTSGALRIHKMIHTGELPYKCNFCDKRFRTPGQVKVHHRRHTGEKPFKCKICSLDFTHRETLISHLSRHIGMKRYKCYGCDKYFVVVSGLRAHRRLRPDTCGKVKFTARAHGPRVRVIKGEVIFEGHPEHNGYLRSEDPLKILSEMNQTDTMTVEDDDKEAEGV
ncbi:uncharacterized protein LOC6642301 isoform X2 [Drosophila willistoni]|uniref:uncharacterized protein LOC6642301 isoform X2 n=1 Tax=Drosophila willistoni TaxID=7260 RepID=UPI000C26D608|nr:uncharacterized protein LOC6642301 isoform X2 [Drosophila willistoni]